MTREEIKNTPELVDFMLDKTILTDSREKLRKRLEEVCDLAIRALEQTRWIPVREREPDTDDEVLCWYKYRTQGKMVSEYGLGRYLRNLSTWCGKVANGRDVEIIAWMPLPEAYNEESEDKECQEKKETTQ